MSSNPCHENHDNSKCANDVRNGILGLLLPADFHREVVVRLGKRAILAVLRDRVLNQLRATDLLPSLALRLALEWSLFGRRRRLLRLGLDRGTALRRGLGRSAILRGRLGCHALGALGAGAGLG